MTDTTIIVTAKDFEVRWDAEHTFAFFEDEQADWLMGFGHIDKAEFAAQVNEYDRICNGEPIDPPYDESAVSHVYARAFIPDGAPSDDWRVTWHDVEPDSEGAFRMTLMSR
jgi:hypothetical protein